MIASYGYLGANELETRKAVQRRYLSLGPLAFGRCIREMLFSAHESSLWLHAP